MTFEDLMPPGLSPADVISIGAGFAAFASVMLVWFALLAPKPLKARLRSIEAARYRNTTARQAAAAAPRRHPVRRTSIGFMKDVVRRLRLLQSNQAQRIGDKLAQAGWRGKDAVVLYLFAKVALPILLGTLAVIALFALQIGEIPDMARLLFALVAVILGAFAPDLLIKNVAQKRAQKIQKALPDGLDLMVICAEAGLSLDATLERVAKELRQSWPEMADEISVTSLELGFLPDRKQALENLSRRVTLSGMRGLVTTLLQTERYGTPLAQALRVLSS